MLIDEVANILLNNYKNIIDSYGLLYAEAVLKFEKLDTQAQQREAVVQGRSLSPYRLRYIYRLRILISSSVNSYNSYTN
ncbi:MAG: hypothetical protein LBL62_07570 [Planctomycetaceae bacterium]|nr:hypothetical protein [Planctomycetaceae bacterium]